MKALKPKSKEAAAVAGEIPEGHKRVTLERTEEFTEPLPPPIVVEDDDLVVNDPDDDLDPVVEVSALDKLLNSIAQTSDDGGNDATVFVRRRPDPLNTKFRDPYNGPGNTTIGRLPFDRSFTSQAAIELAVQEAFEGGYYLFEIQNSEGYVKAWSNVVRDRRLPANEAAPVVAPIVAPVAAPAPAPDSLQYMIDNAEKIERVKKLFSPAAGVSQAPVTPPPTADDLLNQVDKTIEKAESWRARFSPKIDPVETVASSERSWLTDSALVIREVGQFPGVGEFTRPLLGLFGALATEAIISARRKAATDATPGAANQPTNEQTQGALPAAPNGTHAPDGQPPPAMLDSDGDLWAQGFPKPPLPPEAIEVLSAIVVDIGPDAPVENSVKLCMDILQMVGPSQRPFFDLISQKGPVDVLRWLGRVNPAWRMLGSLNHSAEWVRNWQSMMIDALAEMPRAGSETTNEEKNLNATPANGG